MLGGNDAVANIAVRNLETARKFSEDVLGLTPIGIEAEEVIVFMSGNSLRNVLSVAIRRKQQSHGRARKRNNIEDIVRAFRAKGVSFERCDQPGMTRDGDVHVAENMKVAWFKDPEGNILNVINQ